MAQSMSFSLGNRYELEDVIGSGGMGKVYKGFDRLSQQSIALKQLLLPVQTGTLISDGDPSDLRASLAREFQFLASLRHPNIISVLDYGFETDSPYLVMELLDLPQNITDASRDQLLDIQIRYLLELLQALVYLHRRAIIHRDLKPNNVLVVNQQVKVLDFGLSIRRGQSRQLEGTVYYIAPEVFAGRPATESADLYAVGLIAYEVLAGEYPFKPTSAVELFRMVAETPPDMSVVKAPPAVVAVIERLLAKKPRDRYPTAWATLQALAEAANVKLEESLAIREGFLQAAEFVGREPEMAQFQTALTKARAGGGSAWLVAGESGVGKTRLLDELRINAVVDGILVVKGQAVHGGERPYQIWREPVRRLVLTHDVNDFDASVLHEIAPDIGTLLGREVTPLPTLSPAAQQRRLARALIDLIRHARQPILLLLEDLHDSAVGLTLLQSLMQAAPQLSLVIMGTLRHDEAPHLAQDLPEAELVILQRLSTAEIARLSAAMLGENGKRDTVVDYLWQQTEGNTFFLVEVVRALAEESGGLENIGVRTLPAQIYAGGIVQIVRRRLGRAPAEALPLLQTAALMGRQLDIALLSTLMDQPAEQITAWISQSADVGVLGLEQNRWQFAHDRFRETLVADLAPNERASRHRQIATTLETMYPDDETWAAVLMQHWHGAGDVEREFHYSQLAAQQALKHSQNAETVAYAERALALYEQLPNPTPALKARLMHLLGEGHIGLGDLLTAQANFETALKLDLGEDAEINSLLRDGLGEVMLLQGQYETSRQWYQASLPFARQAANPRKLPATLNNLANLLNALGEFELAQGYLLEVLAINRASQQPSDAAFPLNNLGNIALLQGRFDDALKFFQQALPLFEEAGYREGVAIALGNIGGVALQQKELPLALVSLQKSRTIAQSVGNKGLLAAVISMLAETQLAMEDYGEARLTMTEALHMATQASATPMMLEAVRLFAEYEAKRFGGDMAQAVMLLALIVHHPSTGHETSEAARPSLDNLKSGFKADVYAALVEAGKGLQLERVAGRLLGGVE